MNNNKRFIIMDLDGTLFDDFFEADRKIITQIFSSNNFVLFIDTVARIINNLGFIKNTTSILKLRLFVYSFLSLKSYKKVILEYKKSYSKCAYEALKRNYHYIEELKKLKYTVLIFSNNRYSKPISSVYKVFIVKNKPKKIKELYNYYKEQVSFVVGDNYFDEILPARKLSIPNIFIKNKKPSIKRMLKAKDKKCYYSNTLEEVINIIKRS